MAHIHPMAPLLALLIWAVPVQARAGTVVVYDPASHPSAAAALEASAMVLGGAEAEAVSIHDITPPYPEALVPYGAVSVSRCPGDPNPVSALRAGAREGLDAVDELDYRRATELLDATWGDLRCADAFLEAEEIVELPMALGILAHYQGRPEDAAFWFGTTLAIHPAQPWNTDYPPEAQQAFVDAAAAIRGAAPGRVVLEPDSEVTSEVRVDGHTLDPMAPFAEVRPGDHLLQWRTSSGEVESMLVQVAEAGAVVLLSAASLREAILAGPAAGDAFPAVVDRLGVLATRYHAEQVVVLGSGTSTPYRYRTTAETAEPIDIQTTSARPPSPAGPVLVATGAGLAVTGAVMALAAFARGGTLEAEWESRHEQAAWDEYQNTRTTNHVGLVLAAAGGATLGIGIAVAAATRPSRATARGWRPNLQFAATPVPGGGWLQVDLEF